MSEDGSASVFCCTPLRVAANEVGTDLRTPASRRDPESVCSAPALPTGPCPVCPHLAEKFEPYRLAAYWRAQHQRACNREDMLKARVAELEAQLRLREQQLFGRKTETSKTLPDSLPPSSTPAKPKKPRGQQRGTAGHPRRDYSHLPEKIEEHTLPPEQCCCSRCGQPFTTARGSEDSTLLEIEVRAHRRLIRRQRYRPTCHCPQQPGLITAPTAPRVIPKSILGVSIWVTVLLDKYLFYRPTYRLLDELRSHGLDLSLGTITDGMQRLLPLFEPLYQALVSHSQTQTLWHADETRWLVFATVEGKVGSRWYLWVFHGADVVVFVLDPGRAHDVPEEHLAPVEEGILVVDRYAAYAAIEQVKNGKITLAYCWAHVRRDFLAVARSHPLQQEWALAWVQRIGELYHLNEKRQQVREQAEAFVVADARLREAIKQMEMQAHEERSGETVTIEQRKVLESLQHHWEGLTVFVDRPEVPMDNNTAERVQRGVVVGRKNYYGSGALWSGQLAAMLFSVFQTLCLWNLNARAWLTAYLQACAQAGGKAPANVDAFLPWNLSAQQRAEWSFGEPPAKDTS
jgi:transposase